MDTVESIPCLSCGATGDEDCTPQCAPYEASYTLDRPRGWAGHGADALVRATLNPEESGNRARALNGVYSTVDPDGTGGFDVL